MESEAANLPENFPNFQEIGMDTQGERWSAPERRIKGPGGSICTGFYKNFQQLSYDYKKAVFD